MFQLYQNWKKLTSQPDSKGLADHIPSPFICCYESYTRELLWHCGHSERGEPSDSEPTQHASLIAWQRKATAMWQLNATRPSSQSSRKSVTTSLDQSCPMTSMARHCLLCSYFSPPQEVSLAEHELNHSRLIGQPCPHMSPKSGD